MNKRARIYRYALSLTASALLLATVPHRQDAIQINHAGISSAIDSINSTIDEIKKFIDDTKKTVAGVTAFLKKTAAFIDMIGLSTLLLLVSVLFLSSGFSSIGVPSGIPSFFLSLIASDTVWIMWETSFGRNFSEILPGLLKSNLIVFLPLLTVWLIRLAYPGALSFIKKILYRRGNSGLPKSMFIDITEKIQNDWSDFQKNLTRDMIASSGRNEVVISPETDEKIKSIKKNLDNLSFKKDKTNAGNI